MKVMRGWAAQAARTVNSGHYDSRALDRYMAPVFKHAMKKVLGPDVGLHYPGPLPIQPIGVVAISASRRAVKVCAMTDGFALDPKTGKPASKRVVRPAKAYFVKPHGSWRMTGLLPAKNVSCHGVTVKAPTW